MRDFIHLLFPTASKKNGGAKSSSDEENIPSTTRKVTCDGRWGDALPGSGEVMMCFGVQGRTTRKPPSTSKRAKALSVTTQNASVRRSDSFTAVARVCQSRRSRSNSGCRSNRRPLVTPARNMMDSSLMMGATPLITPRFDPRSSHLSRSFGLKPISLFPLPTTEVVRQTSRFRLPKTPAVRVPRHKERVYSISVNGSPIAGGNEDIIINIPSGNGEVSVRRGGLR